MLLAGDSFSSSVVTRTDIRITHFRHLIKMSVRGAAIWITLFGIVVDTIADGTGLTLASTDVDFTDLIS